MPKVSQNEILDYIANFIKEERITAGFTKEQGIPFFKERYKILKGSLDSLVSYVPKRNRKIRIIRWFSNVKEM